MRQENHNLKTEISNYKKELKKKEDSIKELKEEKKTCKKEEERIWKINNDNVDQISILRDEISLKEAKILEIEDIIYTANHEIEEEKIARNAAEEEVRKIKKECDKEEIP